MNLLIAILTSVALGLIGTRYTDYSYWQGWAPGAFRIGVVMLLGVYALGGLLGFVLFDLFGSEGGAVAAAFHGGVGHALLRVQVDRIGPSADSDMTSRNALGLFRDWIFGYLNSRASIGAIQWIRRRSDGDLRTVAIDLFHRRFEVTSKLGKRQLAELTAAAGDLESASEAIIADARGRLRGYCWREVVGQRISKEEL